jgi:negative regulator of flagellin synthesis FlgM
VQLTDTATNLKQVEAWIAELPDVDRARVDAVRQRVESGAYEINPERLANRLLAFERDLARRRSKHC